MYADDLQAVIEGSPKLLLKALEQYKEKLENYPSIASLIEITREIRAIEAQACAIRGPRP
jgi:hypothetical protein